MASSHIANAAVCRLLSMGRLSVVPPVRLFMTHTHLAHPSLPAQRCLHGRAALPSSYALYQCHLRNTAVGPTFTVGVFHPISCTHFLPHRLRHFKARIDNISFARDNAEEIDDVPPLGERSKKKKHKSSTVVPIVKKIEIYDGIPARRLAELVGSTVDNLRPVLEDSGLIFTPGRPISVPVDVAELIVLDRRYKPVRVRAPVTDALPRPPAPKGNLPRRPPVVTIMGHVDHGKTTLLDTLRKSAVAASEAGGITQHIGAFAVALPNGDTVTFLDTPGHEAFSSMRSRGAQATDIVILVVAADDGIMPQTRESIDHARAAGVPIVVAISKIDKSNADVERAKRQLMDAGVRLEDMGGDVLAVPISAVQGTNISQLIEAVSLQAELLDLRGDASGPAEGMVIESRLDRNRGPLVTALVKRGTLKNGDCVVAGTAWGKVRTLVGPLGTAVAAAGPSTPVEIVGFKEVPALGEIILVVPSEERAKSVAELRQSLLDAEMSHEASVAQKKITLAATQERTEDRLALRAMNYRAARAVRNANHGRMIEAKRDEGDGTPCLNVLLKTDVRGSLEALVPCIEALPQDRVRVKIVAAEIGALTDSDVNLADVASAEVILFNAPIPKPVESVARSRGVHISEHRIIYALLDDLRSKMARLLPPVTEVKVIARAEVLAVFNKGKRAGAIAGCKVTEGPLQRKVLARVVRGGAVVHEGRMESLRQVKENVESVQTNVECGLGIEGFDGFVAGDIVENYEIVNVPQSL